MRMQPHDPEEFNSLPESSLPIASYESLLMRGRRAATVVGSFVLGQGALQAIGVLTGLFLVRKLSVEAYAQFGIATGFQSVFTILMDLGFAGTIIPLVGERVGDRALIGRFVRSARHLRNRTFLVLAPVASIAFLATVHNRHWSGRVQVLLLASVLLSLYSSGMVSFFSAPLFLRGKLREFYLPQVASGAGRLLTYEALSAVGGLNAWAAAGVGALNITLNGSLIKRAARSYLDWPAQEDPACDREVLRYVLPATPAIVFSAFQSQISLFLISIFGSTLDLAEVAALSRIGALFLVLHTFNSIIVEPYVARLTRARLLSTFVGFVLLGIGACVPVVFVSFHWPWAVVWILGARFHGLQPYIGWYVLSACTNFVAGLVWIMNRSRKWVFWSGSIFEVVLLLTVQTLFLALVGVHTTGQAVFFMLASSGCYIVAHAYVSIRGFLTTV